MLQTLAYDETMNLYMICLLFYFFVIQGSSGDHLGIEKHFKDFFLGGPGIIWGPSRHLESMIFDPKIYLFMKISIFFLILGS